MLYLDNMTSAISMRKTFLDNYIMSEQVINFFCRHELRAVNCMTEPKFFGFWICNFRNLLCFGVSSTVIRHKEECHIKMYGFSESSHYSLKECSLFYVSLPRVHRTLGPKVAPPRASGCAFL